MPFLKQSRVILALMASLTFLSGLSVPMPLQGAELVGQAINILTATRFGYADSAGNVFKFDYNQTSLAIGKEVSYPFGMTLSPISNCQRTVNTLSVKTMSDYQQQTTSSIKLGAKYKGFSGSYSQSSKQVHEHLAKQDITVSESLTRCVKLQLMLHAGYASFNPMFVDAVKALPTTFSNVSAPAFFKFFEEWNTHVVTKCSVGGAMSELAFTQSSYTKDHTESDIESQASASFLVSIDKKTSSSTTIDKEFQQQTTFNGIEIHGGVPENDQQWPQWMGTVLDLKNPVCSDWQAESVADILCPMWTNDLTLNARSTTVEQALNAFFHRPGCTNPMFKNYDAKALQDNGSCGPRVHNLRVRAWIDLQDSILIGNGNQLQWVHYRGVDVGVQDGHSDPVTLTFTLEDGSVHEERWYAQDNKKYVSPYPLDYCHAALFQKKEGRDTVQMVRPAQSGNAWTNTISFLDDPDGAAWYEFELTWQPTYACINNPAKQRESGNAVVVI